MDAAPENASADVIAPPPADEGPGFPAGLADPAIPLDELRPRLVPLTVEELTALADAWRTNARDATLAVVARSLDPRKAGTRAREADRAAHADLLEARSRIFEKSGALVASLEGKGGDPALIDSLRTYRTAKCPVWPCGYPLSMFCRVDPKQRGRLPRAREDSEC